MIKKILHCLGHANGLGGFGRVSGGPIFWLASHSGPFQAHFYPELTFE